MPLNKSFQYAKTAISSLELSLALSGKRLCVVGGTDGLGRAIARLWASRGAEATVVGRTFRDAGVDRISFVRCDLSLMREAAALGERLPTDVDVLLFTNGIISAPKRQVTAEGIERDMAVSFLSRLALLSTYLPRVQAAAAAAAEPAKVPPLRLFVMGYPGQGKTAVLGDLNSEKSYGVMPAHMNTVAGNEALVLHAATAWRGARAIDVFGLNPGLIKTGIRKNLTGDGFLSRALEWVIGMTNITPEQYAERIVPLLVAPELTGRSGLMFDQAADAILPSAAVTKPEYVAALMAESEGLVARALAAKLTDSA